MKKLDFKVNSKLIEWSKIYARIKQNLVFFFSSNTDWSIGHFQDFNDWLDIIALHCISYLQLLSVVINPHEIVCASVTIVCVMKFFE